LSFLKLKKINIKKNNGSILVNVVIIFMILIILSSVLLDTSVHNYKLSKAVGYMDYSYYAAHAAVEKSIDALDKLSKISSLAIDNGIIFDGDKGNFAEAVFTDILAPYIQNLSNDGDFSNFDVSCDEVSKADVEVSLKYLGYYYDPFTNPEKVTIRIGISANSAYEMRPYTSGEKETFAIKEFDISLPPIFKLRGPIYTIGDFMANNCTVDVNGDVYVYGTSPEVTMQPEQFFYGGIYAKNNAKMRIAGNAYSRSFIRTGEYSKADDNSDIYILRDAVAQGIHVFGRNDRLVVLRNAYTFDDLEMNGENSILAVNGSFFGLSRGGTNSNHDESSAVVNSSPIHHSNSNISLTSRIIINGAVMINGSTFRIDPFTGEAKYEIEDASTAWLDGSPLYKSCPPDLIHGTYKDWILANGYDERSMGFGNIFNAGMPISTSMDIEAADMAISGWIDEINAVRKEGWNEWNPAIRPADEVQGYSNYEMAANDTMYMMNKENEFRSRITRALVLKDRYEIDNIDPPEGEVWNDFWNDALSASWNGGYCEMVRDKLDNVLRPRLMSLTEKFIIREFEESGTGREIIEHKPTKIFNNILHALNNLPSNPCIIRPVNGDLGSYSFEEDKYYLVVNDNPDLTLHINGMTFNGIIFTTGKVVLGNNAIVNGAIIAAGRGYDPDSSKGYIDGSACELDASGTFAARTPRVEIDGSNLEVLDNGGYSAVYCSGGFVNVSFPLQEGNYIPDSGREFLLVKFLEEGIDLYGIF